MSPQHLIQLASPALILALHAPRRITWGYAPDCDIRPPDHTVSRRHGGLFIEGARLFIEDYSSCNGSVVHHAGQRHALHASAWSTPLPLDEPVLVYIGRVELTITQRDDTLRITTPS